VTAAFGDNLADAARQAALPLGLSVDQLAQLQSLGECLNYNGYGETLGDLFFDPAELYRQLRPYADPFAFIAESPPIEPENRLPGRHGARRCRALPKRALRRVFMLPAESGRGGFPACSAINWQSSRPRRRMPCSLPSRMVAMSSACVLRWSPSLARTFCAASSKPVAGARGPPASIICRKPNLAGLLLRSSVFTRRLNGESTHRALRRHLVNLIDPAQGERSGRKPSACLRSTSTGASNANLKC
jgi:hypothetical protein